MLKTFHFARRGARVFALALSAFFLFAAIPCCFPAGGFALSGVAAEGVYTRATPQGLVIAADGMLIIEESDSSSRPTLRAEWKEGEEYATTRWEYSGEGMYPCVSVTTSAEGTTRISFNADGMETERSLFSPDGARLSRIRLEYAPAAGGEGANKPASRTEEAFSPSGELISSERSAYTYNDDGSVKTCAIYKDGAIAKLIQYGEENYRSETVFHEGEALFTAEFRDGERVRAGRRGSAAESR